jgi:tetratricopeptide (TPR) repeat protein
VNYRRFRQGWLEYALARKGVQYPIVKMASKEIALQVGANRGAKAPADQKEMLRWNNYGIALWQQQQYARAVQIFEKVVSINPEYVDGHINIALAQFSYEKYSAALNNLERALALDPKNARALFYRGSIYRIQGKLDAATADLQEVVEQFPRFRDGHRELGFIYYKQRYEAIQGIDPDDLSAHYNLMLVYRRLGMKDKAAVQAAYFADRKDDRIAEASASEFLRSNPVVSNESVPWHVHMLTHTPDTAHAD